MRREFVGQKKADIGETESSPVVRERIAAEDWALRWVDKSKAKQAEEVD